MEILQYEKLFKQLINGILSSKPIQESIGQINFKNKKCNAILCQIPIQKGKIHFPVVITALHPFIGISPDEIEILFHDKKSIIDLNSRVFYSSLEYDIIFFEIKEEDHLEIDKLKEINIEVFKINMDIFLKNVNLPQEIFEIAFAYSFGSIIGINKINISNLTHILGTELHSLIINNTKLLNNGVMKKKYKKKRQFNMGEFIQQTLERFANKIMDIKINISLNISDKYFQDCYIIKSYKSSNKSKESYGDKFYGKSEKIFEDLFITNIPHKSEENSSSIQSYALLNQNYEPNLNDNNFESERTIKIKKQRSKLSSPEAYNNNIIKNCSYSENGLNSNNKNKSLPISKINLTLKI